MDFEKARFNMVEQQIRPWDVLNTQVLDLLFHVKREEFVSDKQKTIAFVDTELPLPNGSRMLEPKMEARLVQELNLAPEDKVLEIGTGSGYLTALLASFSKHVYSLDIDPAMTALAKANLARANIHNVTLVTANGVDGLPTNAPFNAIVVGGSLPTLPEALTSQLAVGGRLLVVLGDAPSMSLTLIERESETGLRTTKLFETVLTPLKDVEQPERFAF
ncbi:protein-L-isoaspartate O-methyltransferase [Aquaspirillum sp. LM1]|jgi:protein-L-isoaspartate(D-aspartate) O-methyltransferase|uniref:protein-L-isoaspartate O-methyltransferase family protein n=1 Tax=Aquaspirillum sp. LM1 TaxID=1938604 RepID=UPI000983C7FF|nr:protein-L-isoaspartate O-methyltransferase [Aquaspirillum sp. LM1]AQR66287.1 protein-L-isoaspartate O-methyltransferase [Aquaspirillum sp. LM1]